ncbi:enoyl-CoA hydratase family protein [Streptomyces lunaelactis]|uniref:enoyl-CoA hydratase family protein n=1 Tax=Streptomyces lunaelactis TaxID=1535768 RepID=UPI001585094A|nr:enoyl-CoA hydratase family protein [Streptomyces lunaelactis]NUK06035.1 enoyl-CoA hydratase family protein [Streptomyces lunaelactis]NUK09836.1 enoyl-CoA hydratase family protein [Streptomyces lunaelactis]NUK17415.1 enoyl-CoA hydratase family protein [Streptomyces lunaelactis]NUK23975.1 enoyl-CoA hydratase family protein [Streptomyces lunaelactis]NUK38989.1 enoyl-CoA hydratase family protein [Streptomyces lunaelactis]
MTILGTAHERGITTLTLDSPANRNALSARLVGELAQALTDCAKDDSVRAVVLTHTGSTFSAGADLKAPPNPYTFVALLRQIVTLPKPVVARVTGHVRAGGLGLLGACDIAAASSASDFAFTEVRIGVAPAVISLPLLERMDPRAAERYYLTGERFDAAEAARIGLLTLAADDVDAALGPVLEGLRKASAQGLAASKELLAARVLETFDRDAEDLVQRSASLFASPEAREGMTAFLERRDPAWVL